MSRRPLAVGVLVLVLVAAGGCRFERRGPAQRDAGAASARGRGETVERARAEDVLEAFQELREEGTVEEARALLHDRAELVDRGARYDRDAPASTLRPLLAPGPGLGPWRLAGVDTLAGDGPRLYVLHYGPAPGAGPEAGAVSVESILLVSTPLGWRVRLLHRSAAP